MHGSLFIALILVLSLYGTRLGEAGQIIEFPSSGTATCAFGIECVRVVQDNGLIITAIPALHHGGVFDVSFHLSGPLGNPVLVDGVPVGTTIDALFVNGEDRGAAEFSLGGQPFDLLSAAISSFGIDSAVIDAFYGDTLRVSELFPGNGALNFTTFQFSDPAWRGITSFVFDTTPTGSNGSFITNVRLHVPVPATWILYVVTFMVIAVRVHGGRRRPSPDRSRLGG